jgi:hypothetical protein
VAKARFDVHSGTSLILGGIMQRNRLMPFIVIAPSVILIAIFVYFFIG